jgi:hypothetical protein
VAWLLIGALPVHADWSDNFNGGLQQVWQFGNVEGSNTFSAGSVNNRLVLTDTRSPSQGGAATGFGVVITQSLGDVRMSGRINPGNSQDINDSVGLLIRGNLLNQTFYMAEINYTDQDLIIYRNGGPDGDRNIAVEPIPDLVFTDSLFVEIEAVGQNLQAWVYDAPGGNLRATTSVVDTSFSSGLAGVLVNENFSSIPVLGVWDDLVVQTVVPTTPGDFDEDGDVDGRDFLVWQRGGLAPPLDAGGLAAWETNFGSPSANLAAVPEPSSLLLAVALGVAALGRAKQR